MILIKTKTIFREGRKMNHNENQIFRKKFKLRTYDNPKIPTFAAPLAWEAQWPRRCSRCPRRFIGTHSMREYVCFILNKIFDVPWESRPTNIPQAWVLVSNHLLFSFRPNLFNKEDNRWYHVKISTGMQLFHSRTRTREVRKRRERSFFKLQLQITNIVTKY